MHDNPLNMNVERRNKERYRKPNDIDTYVLDIFLNRIYLDQDHMNRRETAFMVPFFNPSTGEQFKLPREWSNTPKELHLQYEREYGDKEGFEKPSLTKVYRALDKYKAANILISASNTDKIDTTLKYYPNETIEGFLALLKLVKEDYQHRYYPNNKFRLNPIYSEYANRVLNRQLVLDILKKHVDSIQICSPSGLLNLPILGRYRKNYELVPEIDAWLSMVEELKEIVSDESQTDYRCVKEALLGIDEEMPDEEYYKLTPEKRISNLKKLVRLIHGLESEREFMIRYAEKNADKINDLGTISQFSDKTVDGYSEHVSEMMPDYKGIFDNSFRILGLNWYKDEAVWTKLQLSAKERELLARLPMDPEEYAEYLDDFFIMPLLCLIQLSPNVLYFFLEADWEPKNREFSFSAQHKRVLLQELWTYGVDPNTDKELAGFLLNAKSFNAFLGDLTRIAAIDYLHGNACVIKENSLHSQLNRSRLITFGATNVKLPDTEEFHVPSLFTFSIYKDYTVSILYSELPFINPTDEFLRPVADHPRAGQYDWSPAVGYAYRKVDYPSARMYEIVSRILDPVALGDFCLSHLIDQALLKGTVSPDY